MASSGREIRGLDPFILHDTSPGSQGVKDPSDPDYGVCRVPDTPGSHGTNSDRSAALAASAGDPQPGINPSAGEYTITTIDTGIHRESEPLWYRIVSTLGVVIDAPDGRPVQKAKIEDTKGRLKGQYEVELGKVTDEITVKLKGGFTPATLADALKKGSTEPEALKDGVLESVGFGVGATWKSSSVEWLPEVSFDIIADKDMLPFRFGLKGYFAKPDMKAFVGLNVRARAFAEVKVAFNLTPKAWATVLERAPVAAYELLASWGSSFLSAVVELLPPVVLATAAAGITLGFTWGMMKMADSSQAAGTVQAACLDFAVCYALKVYGSKTNWGANIGLKLQDTSDPLFIKFRKDGEALAIEHARKLGNAVAPGTPYSDDYLLQLLGERKKLAYGVASYDEALDRLYKEAWYEKRKVEKV